MAKHIFVTGGVVSGLGKGISAASLGRLLKQRGLKVAAQKLDPYINVDPGTMSPYQHGEVFVTEDGVETDLDLGHYERFIDEDLNKLSNLTSGRVYWNVLHKERAGEYLGRTVQTIPHITGEIKQFVYGLGDYTGADVVITEIGGTIGDIESQPFLEALRQISREKGRENCMFLHVVLVPWLKCSGEHKTKPAQHSVRELQSMGIMPDVIIARCDEPLEEGILQKLAAFCNVEPDCVIENRTLGSLYEVPLMLHAAGLDDLVCKRLGFETREPDLTEWSALCLGMQIAVIDAARALANLPGANSREFDPEGDACVIDLMPDQQGNLPKGGTMRLGAYPCAVQPGTLLHRIYGQSMISERHRHRYEVSNDFRAALSEAGVVFSGLSPDGRLVEAMELPGHPFFVGVQYHPEFKSRPDKPQPIFRDFVAAALDHQNA